MRDKIEFATMSPLLSEGAQIYSSHDWDAACDANPDYVQGAYIPTPWELHEVQQQGMVENE